MEVGQNESGYTLTRIVGRGSRAIVWEAERSDTGERVALKVLDTVADSAPDRLRAEFSAQVRLDHPNIVSVHEIIEFDGKLSLVAELVDGCDLREYIDRYKPDTTAAVRVFGGIMRGLAAAQDQGLVHRDLKPGNILMTAGNQSIPKISDFGIVKAENSLDLTQTGMVLGTLRYMPPEQLQNPSGVDQRADLFSAGCILFELLTHKRLFDGPNKVALMNAVRMGTHTPFPEDLDPELRSLIETLIHPDREQRPASAADVLERMGLSIDPEVELTVPIPIELAPKKLPFIWITLGFAALLIAGIALGLGITALVSR